jgi:hypothetical protein
MKLKKGTDIRVSFSLPYHSGEWKERKNNVVLVKALQELGADSYDIHDLLWMLATGRLPTNLEWELRTQATPENLKADWRTYSQVSIEELIEKKWFSQSALKKVKKQLLKLFKI